MPDQNTSEQLNDLESLRCQFRRAQSAVRHLLNHCKDAECEECSKIVCPAAEPFHFHHDGCPACYNTEELLEIGRNWRTDSSIEKWFPISAEELTRLRSENSTLTRQRDELLKACKAALSCGLNEEPHGVGCAASRQEIRAYETASQIRKAIELTEPKASK